MKAFGYVEYDNKIVLFRCLPYSDKERLKRFVDLMGKKNKELYVLSAGPYVNPKRVLKDIGIDITQQPKQNIIAKYWSYLEKHAQDESIAKKNYPVLDMKRGILINYKEAQKLGCKPLVENVKFITEHFKSLQKEPDLLESRCRNCKLFLLKKFSVCPRCNQCIRCYKVSTRKICWYCRNGAKTFNQFSRKKVTRYPGREITPGKYFVR